MAEERAAVGPLRVLGIISAGVLLLLALLWFVFVFNAPQRTHRPPSAMVEAPPPEAPAAARPVEPPPDPPPEEHEPEPLPAVTMAPTRTPGPTRFVRRLVVGNLLRNRSGNLTEREAARLVEQVRPHLLSADGKLPGKALDQVGFLTHPPRDTEALRFAHNAFPDDPFGERTRLRIWTPDGAYPWDEWSAANELLGHLEEVAGTRLRGGADVLVTQRFGRDVFPRQHHPAWAAGVYFVRDRYCIVRAELKPAFRFEVLKHELIHAYCRGFTRNFTSSRCVSEGLAEYLRFWRRGDNGFRIPVERMADALMALHVRLVWLERAGAPVERIQPAAILRLKPWQFYQLRGLAYLIAHAAIAFVGGETVESAFRERSAGRIERAIKKISWREFRAFVESGGQHGVAARAIVVEDSPERVKDPQDAHRLLGLDGPDLPHDLLHIVPDSPVFDSAQLEKVLDAIETGQGRPVIICTDQPGQMDFVRESGETGWDAFRRLKRRFDPRITLRLGKTVDGAELNGISGRIDYDVAGLMDTLANGDLEALSLVIVAGGDAGPGELPRLEPPAVLVVDLGKSSDAARRIALALAGRDGYRGLVAYTRPR